MPHKKRRTARGANEYVGSNSSHRMFKSRYERYVDKMNLASSIDEIAAIANNFINETNNKKNKEYIKSYDRGKAKIKLHDGIYEAEVLIANYKNGERYFYDILFLNKKVDAANLGVTKKVVVPKTTSTIESIDEKNVNVNTGKQDIQHNIEFDGQDARNNEAQRYEEALTEGVRFEEEDAARLGQDNQT